MTTTNAKPGPPPEFYWDDIVIGDTLRSGSYVLSEAEVIDFASRYDPLPIHVDHAVAAAAPAASITASGSHMLALRQKLVHEFAFVAGVIASVGYDYVRFLAPLRAGRSCEVEILFLDKRVSSKREDRGLVTLEITLLADDEAVLRLKDTVLMRRRNRLDSPLTC